MPKWEDPLVTAQWEQAKQMGYQPVAKTMVRRPPPGHSSDQACLYCRRLHKETTCPGCGAPRTEVKIKK